MDTVNTIYLPVISNNYNPPLFTCSLGAQIEDGAEGKVKWIIPDRVYQYSVLWRDVEPEQGTYNWLPVYEKNHEILADYETIITVKGTPAWASLWDDLGSPPKPEYYGDLGRFIEALCERYQPRAVELYNEPDVRRGEGYPPLYGAWVNTGESFYQGGCRYGETAQYVSGYCTAPLLAGALLMSNSSQEFLAGALDSGLEADAISYHCYTNSASQFGRYIELSGRLAAQVDLPQVITETSFLGVEDTPEFRQLQMDYVVFLRNTYKTTGVQLINIYTLAGNGWMNSDLIRGGITPMYEAWSSA